MRRAFNCGQIYFALEAFPLCYFSGLAASFFVRLFFFSLAHRVFSPSFFFGLHVYVVYVWPFFFPSLPTSQPLVLLPLSLMRAQQSLDSDERQSRELFASEGRLLHCFPKKSCTLVHLEVMRVSSLRVTQLSGLRLSRRLANVPLCVSILLCFQCRQRLGFMLTT